VSNRAHFAMAILIALALLFMWRLVRRRHLKAKYSLLWLSVGGVLAVFAAVPGLLDWSATRLGIYYQPTLLILLALALLLLVVVHFSYELTRMEARVRTLAEEAALVRRRLVVLEQRLSDLDGGGTAESGEGADAVGGSLTAEHAVGEHDDGDESPPARAAG
jgi:hypothetical protein